MVLPTSLSPNTTNFNMIPILPIVVEYLLNKFVPVICFVVAEGGMTPLLDGGGNSRYGGICEGEFSLNERGDLNGLIPRGVCDIFLDRERCEERIDDYTLG